VPPDEVARLISLGRTASAAGSGVAPGPAPFGAPAASTPKSTLELPEFRDGTPAQVAEAERLLTAANLARRRGRFGDAERSCLEAITLVPKDASALEMLGDILQELGRVDDAIACYKRATEADSARKSAERKYGELTLMQDPDIERLRQEYIPRNANVAVLFSALCPGAGQMYNGDQAKALIIALLALLCVIILGWTPLGFPGRATGGGVSMSLACFLLVAAAVYLYGVIDAARGARATGSRSRKSGWEV